MGGGGGGGSSGGQAAIYTRPGQNPSTQTGGPPGTGIWWGVPGYDSRTGWSDTSGSPGGLYGNNYNPMNEQGWPGAYHYDLPQFQKPGQTYSQPAPQSIGMGPTQGGYNPLAAFGLGQMIARMLSSGGGPFAQGTNFSNLVGTNNTTFSGSGR
jgi:hypothetical protein